MVEYHPRILIPKPLPLVQLCQSNSGCRCCLVFVLFWQKHAFKFVTVCWICCNICFGTENMEYFHEKLWHETFMNRWPFFFPIKYCILQYVPISFYFVFQFCCWYLLIHTFGPFPNSGYGKRHTGIGWIFASKWFVFETNFVCLIYFL